MTFSEPSQFSIGRLALMGTDARPAVLAGGVGWFQPGGVDGGPCAPAGVGVERDGLDLVDGPLPEVEPHVPTVLPGT